MQPIIQAGFNAAFKTIFAGCSTATFGAAAISGLALWGGKKVLEMQYQPDGSQRNDLMLCQKTAINISGHALIVIGILAGFLACALFGFVVAPFIGVSFCVIAGASAAVTSVVFNVSIVAGLLFSLSGLVNGAICAYSPLCRRPMPPPTHQLIPPHAPLALA